MSKKKYFTPEQKREAEKLLASIRGKRRNRNRGNRAKVNAQARARYDAAVRGRYEILHDVQDAVVRPPPELVAERDFRLGLLSLMSMSEQAAGNPPGAYAGAYYHRAWHFQREFAGGA